MGRGRGKGRKQTTLATREDLGIGEEEKIQPSRRRGRPTKAQLRAEMEEREEAMGKLELEDDEEEDGGTKKSPSSNGKDQGLAENGQKRKRSSPLKENQDSVKDEVGAGKEIQIDSSVASLGFRQNGSRRKNKPRRAAEVGVEC